MSQTIKKFEVCEYMRDGWFEFLERNYFGVVEDDYLKFTKFLNKNSSILKLRDSNFS